MLRDAAKRFLADNCPTKFVRQMMADTTAHDAAFWKKLVDLGWPGLLAARATAPAEAGTVDHYPGPLRGVLRNSTLVVGRRSPQIGLDVRGKART